jgi:hypothetical protein
MTDTIRLSVYRTRPSVAAVREYLLSKGWVAHCSSETPMIGTIFRYGREPFGKTEERQLSVPDRDDFGDIGPCVLRIIVILAEYEGRQQDEVWADIMKEKNDDKIRT